MGSTVVLGNFDHVKLGISVLGFVSGPLVCNCLVSLLLRTACFVSAVIVSCFVSVLLAASLVSVLLVACFLFVLLLVRFVCSVLLQLVACYVSFACFSLALSLLLRSCFTIAWSLQFCFALTLSVLSTYWLLFLLVFLFLCFSPCRLLCFCLFSLF